MLSIENKVSGITYIETFILKLENRGIYQVPNYLLKAYMGCWALVLRLIYLVRSQLHKIPFYWNYRIDCAFGVLKIRLKKGKFEK